MALAGLTGLLFYFSFPGVDWWPLAFLVWVPWIVALEGASGKEAAWQGLIAGLAMGIPGFYWLLDMLERFSGFPPWLCTIFMLLLCSYQAGRYVLMGVVYAAGRKRGWPAGPAFLGAFVLGETAYPLLFPFTFGATLHSAYPLVQVAELGGTIAVGLIALAPNWLMGRLVIEWLRARARSPESPLGVAWSRLPKVAAAVLLSTPGLAAVYGLMRIEQVDAAVERAEKIRVGIVQANMGLLEKRSSPGEGLRRHVRLTRKAVRELGAEFVVWPETSVAGAVPEAEVEEFYRTRVTRRLGVPAIVGAIISREVDDQRGYVLYNSALLADDQGVIRGRYDKQFLLAFGEYLPMGEAFPVLYEYSPNSGRFSPGTSFKSLDFEGHEIATFICYEDIAPSFVNKLMRHGKPELLVNMTNDAWFGDSSEPWEHMALAKLRAVEHRRFFVRSTNSGISGVVDPVGRLLARTPTFEQAVIAEDVAWLSLKSPYTFWGNTPWHLVSALTVVAAFVRRPRRAAGGNPPTHSSAAV